MVPDEDEQLIQDARERSRLLSPAALEEQARSFATGNAGIEDPRVTREVVDRAAALTHR